MTKIYFILIFLISFVTVYAQNESDSAQVAAQTEMPQNAAVQTSQQRQKLIVHI